VEAAAQGVSVTRIGTQVVVRLSGDVGDARAPRLAAAVDEVAGLVLQRVVVDLEEVTSIEGAGVDFLAELHRRWQLRLLNTPAALRSALPRQAPRRESRGRPAGPAVTLPAP
jgi:anti-anti-sigma regulatory factor